MKVVFFDGHCNLCNRFVDFLIRRDVHGALHFASLQGETAIQNLPIALREELSTVVLWESDSPSPAMGGTSVNPQMFTKSTAALRAIAALGGMYGWVILFLVIPRFLRDPIYFLIARNRYRIWGRGETCRLPSGQEAGRFLP